jgi:hypothetical protein
VSQPAALAAMDALLLAASSYDLPPDLEVRYTYWPVSYFLGDPHVISNAPLPLSGVNFSRLMKGVGELRASLQLADEDVRAMNPWELVVPRKTGIVVVRTVVDAEAGTEAHTIEWHGIVWDRKPVPATGRWEIVARTIEYNWSRRLITGPMAGGALVWAQKDRTKIVQDLLTPALFSQIGPADNLGQATASLAGTSTTIVVPTAQAALISTGTYAQVVDTFGNYRVIPTGDNIVRITSKSGPSGGNVTITFTPALTTTTAIGDVITSVALFPGWVHVDKPVTLTGRLHDHSYKRDQQTNLLTAHQDRSNVDDGYDWFTSMRVLDGANALDAASYRVQYVMGYPRVGRVYGEDDIARFTYRTTGEGNVTEVTPVYNGEGVANVVWGQGAGYDASALRQFATNSSDWQNGFMITEDRYSNPDVSRADTLLAYTISALFQSYANERFVQAIKIRGDKPPYFGTYSLGDDALYTSDDWTNPDGPDGDRDTTYLTRIMGWTVTPPEGTNSESVQLVLASGLEATEDG